MKPLLVTIFFSIAVVIPTAYGVDVTVSPGQSIQSAVNAASGSASKRYVIHVKAGTYHEVVHIPKGKNFITITGDGKNTTHITYGNYASLKNMGTSDSATFFVDGDDFTAENIAFENSAGNVGQAVAINIKGDRAIFRTCNFIGWQDTVYANSGHHYFKNCYISGSVDFIFGGATAYFDSCTIHARNRGATADMITAASTPPGQANGFVFNQCKFEGDSNTKAHLGRPWHPYAAVTIIYSQMSDAILAEGWTHWSTDSDVANARYYEYGNTGAGASTSGRKFSHVISKAQADALTTYKVLGFNV